MFMLLLNIINVFYIIQQKLRKKNYKKLLVNFLKSLSLGTYNSGISFTCGGSYFCSQNQTLLAPNHIGLSHVPANMTEALSINTAMSERLTIKGVPLFVPSLFLTTISKSVPFASSIDPLIIQRELLLAFVPDCF